MTSLTTLVLSLLFLIQSGLLVREVASPIRPGNASGPGLTVIEVRLNRLFQPMTRIIRGEAPFLEPAIEAVKSWRFYPPADPKAGFASVSFLFRPASADVIKLGLDPTAASVVEASHPPIPTKIVDPGYPASCLEGGVVTLEVSIDRTGNVTRIRALSGPAAFWDDAERAVKQWTFTPARLDGRPVTSTSYVVISFVRPLT